MTATRTKPKRKFVHPVFLQLREKRRKLRISQKDLGKMIGVNASCICFWEKGYRYPGWFNMECWMQTLRFELPELKDLDDGREQLDS